MVECYEAKKVKSRKSGRCEWCGESFTAGDEVVAVSGKCGGDWFRVREHPECHAAINTLKADDPIIQDGYEFGAGKRGSAEPR